MNIFLGRQKEENVTVTLTLPTHCQRCLASLNVSVSVVFSVSYNVIDYLCNDLLLIASERY